MLIILLISLGLVAVLVYCSRMLLYANALRRAATVSHAAAEPAMLRVSVVIPVRNERAHLGNLLVDVMNIDYPDRLYEVLFIDDHSDDGSAGFLEDALAGLPNHKLLKLSPGVTGKKEAVEAGVQHAAGEWILQLDADCRIPAGLVREHAHRAAWGDVNLVAGPVLYPDGRNVAGKFEALEFMSLTAAGMASFYAGRPIMCNGANLSYDRTFYRGVSDRLLNRNTVSGDDIFLLQEAIDGDAGVAYLAGMNSLVEAEPAASLAGFFRQRTRWGSKAVYYTDSEMVFMAVLVWLVNLLLSVLCISALFSPRLFLVFIPLWAIRAASDLLLLYRFAVLFERTRLLMWFLPASLFYYFYIAVAGLLSLFGSFSWKGRKYRKFRNRRG